MVYLTGDTHIPIDIRKLSAANFCEQRTMTRDDFVIVCGDFGGVWNNSPEELYWRKWLKDKNFTTLFVDGNHENFSLLNSFPVEERYGGSVHVIEENVLHLMRGNVFTLCGERFFCMGGASSHDKEYRVPSISWWDEEIPSEAEFEYALQTLDRNDWFVDYIITHCAPTAIQHRITDWYENDQLTSFLQFVDDRCSFRQWFFGHYHVDAEIDEKHSALYNRIIPLVRGVDR